MTFNDKKDDSVLMRKIEFEIMTDYFPNDVENLKSVYEAGDMDAVARAVKSITSSKINIESVQTSYPLFDFTKDKEVVVKVMYSLDDAYGKREKGTNYYRFDHGSLGNVWRYKYKTGALSYYLNFL
jgi:hypothetical protein